MNAKFVKNITLKSIQIQINEAAAKGKNYIEIPDIVPEFVVSYFENKGYVVQQFVPAEIKSNFGISIFPSKLAKITWL